MSYSNDSIFVHKAPRRRSANDIKSATEHVRAATRLDQPIDDDNRLFRNLDDRITELTQEI